MEFKDLQKKALELRGKYAQFEKNKYGREWTRQELMQGFIVDIGELAELMMAKEGIRSGENVDDKLKHEFADCLWSLFVLAEKYGVDLEDSFLQTSNLLEKKLSSQENGK
jgi:NTP pyrophosphatase (non-canonical NTP hydrolase)